MIRYAILTSVSTPEQARKDKISLEHQLGVCQAAAESNAANGWVESAGPFIVDGYSRSSYINLSDAERDIPPLHAALEDLRADRYDLLIIFSYDRFGDLTLFLANEFRNYKKQIYSVSQPSIVQEPQLFNPYFNESAQIQQDAARLIQHFRINDLRRKWYAGIPKRIKDGLTPFKNSFGYRWMGKKEPPVQIPAQVALLHQMKDWLFEGASMLLIARRADSSGILPPHGGDHWEASSIRHILANPYYTGQVSFHKSVYVHDETRKRKHRPIPQPRSKWETAEGKHQPLWDEATHHAILAELDRRHQRDQRSAARFPLSGLLYCSICKRKLHRRTHGWRDGRRKVLSCEAGPAHIILPYDQAIKDISLALQESLIHPSPPKYPEGTEGIWGDARRAGGPTELQSDLAEIERNRHRTQQGYKAGVFSTVEAAQEIARLDASAEDIRSRLERLELNRSLTSQAKQTLATLDLSHFAEWIQTDDPAIVNRLLSAICSQIILTPAGDIHIEFK